MTQKYSSNVLTQEKITHQPSAAVINQLLNYSKSLAVVKTKQKTVVLNMN